MANIGFNFGDLIGQFSALIQGVNATKELDEIFVHDFFLQEDLESMELDYQLTKARQRERYKMYVAVLLLLVIVSLVVYVVLRR